jgi:hypothetical protein
MSHARRPSPLALRCVVASALLLAVAAPRLHGAAVEHEDFCQLAFGKALPKFQGALMKCAEQCHRAAAAGVHPVTD